MSAAMWLVGILCVLLLLTISLLVTRVASATPYLFNAVDHAKKGKIDMLFSGTSSDLFTRRDEAIDAIREAIKKIECLKPEQSHFNNTIVAFDSIGALSDAAILANVVSVLEVTSTDKKIRDAAHEVYKDLERVFIDEVNTNRRLYTVISTFINSIDVKKAGFNDAQLEYMQNVMNDFKAAGMHLPSHLAQKVAGLKRQLSQLYQAFERNNAEDNTTITVSKQELRGLDEQYIQQLKQDADDRYILGIDYPTYFEVLRHCLVESTRKKMYDAYINRAYPKNAEVLKHIIVARDELAKELGYKDWASFSLEFEMVDDPEKVKEFLDTLSRYAIPKANEEIQILTKDLPESVHLAKDGKVKPWDLELLKTFYKKKHGDVDERMVAEYFPMRQTIERLLQIYSRFLSLRFKLAPCKVWHEDVHLVHVSRAEDPDTVIGYLYLDLFPRPHKYNHACHATIVPAVNNPEVGRVPAVAVVIANFPKPTGEIPALLPLKDVQTFFHEFGHALHGVLGVTEMGAASGTRVRRDFVELPSQILEEWLWDKEILQLVSGHYQTGKPLPDHVIDAILKLRNFDSGLFVEVQSFYAYFSLELFQSKPDEDIDALLYALYKKYRPNVTWYENNHFYANFGHLIGYDARYYGYLWSRVLAADVFDAIKKEGLLNPKVGTRYANAILVPGGSAHPNTLLFNFLGREPNQRSFLRDAGFLEVHHT